MDTKRIPIWLDCDMEYDDAMAMILAAYNPKIKLLGISTVHGVVSAEKSATYAIQVLELACIEGIDVVTGATEAICRPPRTWEDFHGTSAVDWANLPPPSGKHAPLKKNAILHMYDTIMAQPEKVTLVGTAQFTNIALLIKSFPEIKVKIDQILLLGGAYGLGNVNAAAEFNVSGDPEAAKIILDSGLKVVMIPLDVTSKIAFTEDIQAALKGLKSDFGEYCIKLLTFFKTVYSREVTNVHDPLTVAYLIDSTLLKTDFMVIEVECGSTCSDGHTNCDLKHRSKKPKNVHLALDVNAQGFWKIMLDALTEANKRWVAAQAH